MFEPAHLTVAVGDTIIWRNEDDAPHTASRQGGGPTSPQLQQGDEYTYKVTDAKSIEYLCAVHPQMKGRITVKE